MNPANTLAILENWQACMAEAELQLSVLDRIIGSHPDSPLMSAIHHIMGELTRQIAAQIGCSEEWLEVWWLECDFGANALRAGTVGEPLREITTVQELAQLIGDDIEKSDQECR